MPKAKPFKSRMKTPKEREERYVKDLKAFRPDMDGRTRRALARRLSKTKDLYELSNLLAEELNDERLAIPRRSRSTDV